MRLNKLLGPRPGITREQYAGYLKQQEDNVKELERQLKSKRDDYEVNGSRLSARVADTRNDSA